MSDWIYFKEATPDNTGDEEPYYISGHEWSGIGLWCNKRGFLKGYIGDFPYGPENMIDGEFLNHHTLWWKPFDYNYPIYPKSKPEQSWKDLTSG